MKQIIALLLLLIVGVTTFSQCCTKDNCAQEQTSATSPSPEDGEEEGACSPFSSCTTCFGFTAQVSCVQVAVPVATLPQHRSLEQAPLLPLVAFTFWQPPRTAAPDC